jgi:hypothetical protein
LDDAELCVLRDRHHRFPSGRLSRALTTYAPPTAKVCRRFSARFYAETLQFSGQYLRRGGFSIRPYDINNIDKLKSRTLCHGTQHSIGRGGRLFLCPRSLFHFLALMCYLCDAEKFFTPFPKSVARLRATFAPFATKGEYRERSILLCY